MRLLIAGWQGQLAHALVENALRRSDVEACSIGRPALDICQLPTIERALSDVRPDVVINTAAYTAVDAAELNEASAFALNAGGAGEIAKAAAARGLPIIHVSTDYVFDGLKPAPYVETDPAAPRTVYGRSKLAGESAIARANHQHIILRTSWVYSPFGRNFLKTMLARRDGPGVVEVVDDQWGSPTYAPHLADAILALASQFTGPSAGADPARWGIYHAAGGGETSWYEFARAIFSEATPRGETQAAVLPIAASRYPTVAPRLSNSRLDCTKLNTTFGIALPHWREGVRQCLERLTAAHAAGIAGRR